MKVSKYFKPEDFKLCYVDGAFAYFTSQEISKQWGDDWNDAPYEHNAGLPYTPTIFHYANGENKKDPRDWNEDGTPKWEIINVAFSADFQTPREGHLNSPYSVENINGGAVAWLAPNAFWSSHNISITAGTNLIEFIRKIELAKGDVYIPYSWLNQGEGSQRSVATK